MAKKTIPENTGVWFELFGISNRIFILKDNTTLDFRLGMPFHSLDIYKKGEFRFIGLKEGAEILFKKETPEELIKLINQANRKEDILILGKASDSEKVQSAAAEKLKSFS